MTQIRRVAFASRVFTLSALWTFSTILGLSVVNGVLLVTAIGAVATGLSLTRRVPEAWVAVLEGVATALVAWALVPDNTTVVPYLAIPALIGGLAGRYWGVLRVVVAEFLAVVLGYLLFSDTLDREVAAGGILWLVTGLGLGIGGAAVQKVLSESVDESSYRSAVDLIKQLHKLSGRLTEGLDVVGIAESMMALAGDRLPIRQAAVFVRSANGTISPLRYAPGSDPDAFPDASDRVQATYLERAAQHDGQSITVPLMNGDELVAVLVAECLHSPAPEAVHALGGALSADALKLYAALLFREVRDAATSDERQRLAREVHDGIAQDVASLGYLVDSVLPRDDDQAAQLTDLRTEVTRVVGELRHSVFDLRNEVGSSQGLGESLHALAGHIGSRSTMIVHVRIDETTTRLRTDVEAHLFRIAQEAMNNARKHAHAENLWLSGTVNPPGAEIEVCDDGIGLGEGRSDSHGLKIMRERAEQIGATLEITSPAKQGGGTRVRVTLPGLGR